MIRIRIWHATSSPTEAGLVERACESYLNADERVRADRFRQPTSRNQHVIGRGMARRLIGEHAGIDPTQIRFDLEPYGKPFVCDPPQAVRPFNVAHTHGLVLCGLFDTSRVEEGAAKVDSLDVGSGYFGSDHVGSDHVTDRIKLGVDVEGLDRRTDPAIAERFFSQPEIRYLQTQQSDQSRRVAFLRIWTLKESFIKAIGTGMATPLADFAFEHIDSDQPRIRMLSDKLDQGETWQFRVFEPRPGYIAAAAVTMGEKTAVPNMLLHSFDELVDC
ncbi:4'-phosphopantetheinyl transferase superfamily protein [Rubripirellula amarantea]|nr:4'-phosphopantetheinyl transferase superfamily protein [Rubripirellula amarantea]